MRNKRVYLPLGTILDMLTAIERGDIAAVKETLTRAAAVEERDQLRNVRNEVWQRYQNAIHSGDATAAAEFRAMLNQVTELSKQYKV